MFNLKNEIWIANPIVWGLVVFLIATYIGYSYLSTWSIGLFPVVWGMILLLSKIRESKESGQSADKGSDEERLATLKRRRKLAELIQGALIWVAALAFFWWLVVMATKGV